jgi:cytochrome c
MYRLLTVVGLGVASAAVLVGSSLKPVAAQDDAGTASYYSEKVRPIFEQRCGMCHLNGNFSGGFGLGTKADTLLGGDKAADVMPGDPAKSMLVKLIRQEGGPDDPKNMPLGRNKISDREIEIITNWVKAGAVMPPDTPQLIQAAGVRQTMKLYAAKMMVAAVKTAAEEQKEHISVCVMDMNGDIVAFARMDKTEPSQLGTSQGKARAVLLFGMPTGVIADAQRANKPVTAMIASPAAGAVGGQITLTSGGLPIMKDGVMIGSIGVGGSLSGQDEKYAQIGIKAAGMTGSK